MAIIAQGLTVLAGLAGTIIGVVVLGAETTISPRAIVMLTLVNLALMLPLALSFIRPRFAVHAQWLGAVLTIAFVVVTVFSLGWFLFPAAVLCLLAAALLVGVRGHHLLAH